MEIRESLDRLQRQDLNIDHLDLPDPFPHLSNFLLYRIKSTIRATNIDLHDYQALMESLIIGQFFSNSSILFMIVGQPRNISIYMGNGDNSFESILRATFKGISLEKPLEFKEIISRVPKTDVFGAITGIPTGRLVDSTDTIDLEIDRLIKGMYGENWIYLIFAQPVDSLFIQREFFRIADEIKNINLSYLTKGTLREENRVVREYIEILEVYLEKLKHAQNIGMWAVQTYVLTCSEQALKRAFMLFESVYQGENSRPQPIRTHRCNFGTSGAKPVATLTNSRDLSILIQLPREEMPGYSLKIYNRFDVDIKKTPIHPVAIGEVIDYDHPLGYWLDLERDDFVSHLLVSGITGSGKTTALMFLLDQLWNEHAIPFLVIEPAKHEYRSFLISNRIKDLQIYTLGDERISPFRLNPFEVQKGSLIQTHIDYLKSVFNASFSMVTPMPYILEESIIRVYQDKGWDLATNLNRNGFDPNAFPILYDLYLKIEEVVLEKAYEERIKADIIAALRTRINNLMIGAKGLMLNSQSSLDIHMLLNKPTILELEAIGDDEEKAFIMGIILARIYEYRKAQRNIIHGLQHITVIEEAHRLLRNVPLDIPNTEVANLRGKAVETFCNILAEIRAYGESLWLAEQIPSKLAPDARKNTETKLLFRLTSREDAKVMGDSMNLKEEELEFVASLETGQALVFSKGMDRPVLVKTPNFKSYCLKEDEITDGRLRKHLGRDLPYRKEEVA